MNRALLLAFAGIYLFAPVAMHADQLVTNGGFETGDLSGWTQSGNSTVYNTGVWLLDPHSGNYDAYLGPGGSDGYLSQTLNTVAGEAYQVTFWLASDGGIPNDFSAMFGNNVLFSQSNLPASGWTEYSYTELAASDSTVLQFGFRDDPGYLFLDDVSVSSVSTVAPEPSTWASASLAGLFLVAAAWQRKRRAANQEGTL